MLKPLTSSFRSAACRFWGLFVGTYWTAAYAALTGGNYFGGITETSYKYASKKPTLCEELELGLLTHLLKRDVAAGAH
jgi:hypothetical protein